MKAREILDYLHESYPTLRDMALADCQNELQIVRGQLSAIRDRAETTEGTLVQCRDELDDLMAQRDAAEQMRERAESVLAERDKPCKWTVDDDWYTTGCGSAFSGIEASYCPTCGHHIEVQP